MSLLLKIRGQQAVELAGYALTAAAVSAKTAYMARRADGSHVGGTNEEESRSELTGHSLKVVADAYRAAAHACFAELARVIEDCK